MHFKSDYLSPLGKITLYANENELCGLWFVGQKYYAKTMIQPFVESENEIIKQTKTWLDIYFSGNNPEFKIETLPQGSDFQKRIWSILEQIPYGTTCSYEQIAKIAKCKSAIAVGSAIGKNPISIIVPCHRIIAKSGKISGYAGGENRKKKLLLLEKNIS